MIGLNLKSLTEHRLRFYVNVINNVCLCLRSFTGLHSNVQVTLASTLIPVPARARHLVQGSRATHSQYTGKTRNLSLSLSLSQPSFSSPEPKAQNELL